MKIRLTFLLLAMSLGVNAQLNWMTPKVGYDFINDEPAVELAVTGIVFLDASAEINLAGEWNIWAGMGLPFELEFTDKPGHDIVKIGSLFTLNDGFHVKPYIGLWPKNTRWWLEGQFNSRQTSVNFRLGYIIGKYSPEFIHGSL